MLAYVTLGANDIEKARAFYGALLGEIGARNYSPLPVDGCIFMAPAWAHR